MFQLDNSNNSTADIERALFEATTHQLLNALADRVEENK